MLDFLGWFGFWLLVGSMVPLVLRRLRLQYAQKTISAHHTLALVSLGVLTLHGLLALTGRHGWRHGFRPHVDEMIFGIFAWSVLLAICILAFGAIRKKPFSRTHCWLVALLVLLVFAHAF